MNSIEIRLRSRLKLPEFITLAFGAIPELQQPLFPTEEPAIAQAVPKRCHEFIAGRTIARNALARLGILPQAISQKKDRSPAWPNGVVGSISHSDTSAIAATGMGIAVASIGIDVETLGRVTPDLWKALFSEGEQRALNDAPDWAPVLFFSAKEAFFKCQYPLTNQMLSFLDLEVALSSAHQCSVTQKTPLRNDIPKGRLMVTYLQHANEMITFCYLQPSK